LTERNGPKLYVPVEQPTQNEEPKPKSRQNTDEDVMQLDDSKHKVYIYDLDAELSDSSESDDGKLVFLPNIEKHLRENRIPASIRANSEGELAGNNLQLVLYNVPSSLTVPEEQDSVRKAIIETRARARAKQDQKRNEDTRNPQTTKAALSENFGWYHGMVNGHTSNASGEPMQDGHAAHLPQERAEFDPDAMDLG